MQYGLDSIISTLQMRTQAYPSLPKILFIHQVLTELFGMPENTKMNVGMALISDGGLVSR